MGLGQGGGAAGGPAGDVPYQEFELFAEDMLFLPVRYLHSVTTESPLAAHLSFMWQRGDDDVPVEV